MQAGKVVQLAHQWVLAEGAQIPSFVGAHLQGSLEMMQPL